ncbi:hypothetical protein [Thiogranum longum]
MNIAIPFLVYAGVALSTSLPDGYRLEKNDKGERFLSNGDGEVVVEPNILSYGYDDDRFVACITNESPDKELKRYVVVRFSDGRVRDTGNLHNWHHLLEDIAGLEEIELHPITKETCP